MRTDEGRTGADPRARHRGGHDDAGSGARTAAFLFPGVGDHYPGMGRGLYEREGTFRAEVDRCAEILGPHLGPDVREVLYPGTRAGRGDPASGSIDFRQMLGRGGAPSAGVPALDRTELAHPAVFVVEYALARLWMARGVVPDCMIGHSLGEYVAATVAGVFSLGDALALVAARARMIEALPAGAMLAVPLPEAELRPFLRDGVALAAVNAPGLCSVSGPPDAVAALEAELWRRGVGARRLRASHAFHSAMMEPVAGRLAERMGGMELRPPSIPFLSNVTGTWITAEEACAPGYWAGHLTRTVRFADGMREALRSPGRIFLDVGPGRALGAFAVQAGVPEGHVLSSLRHSYVSRPDAALFLETVSRLRMLGLRVEPDPADPDPPRGRDEDAAPPPAGAGYTAPSDDAERVLAQVWGEVLGVPDVGVHDDFFGFGGHSLHAARIVARLREVAGVELSVRDIFAAPTVAELAPLIRGRPLAPAGRNGGGDAPPALPGGDA